MLSVSEQEAQTAGPVPLPYAVPADLAAKAPILAAKLENLPAGQLLMLFPSENSVGAM